MLLWLCCCFPLLSLAKGPKKKALDGVFFSPQLWDVTLQSFHQKYGESKKGKKKEIDPQLLKKLKEQGVDVSQFKVATPSFEWLSSDKKGLRATGGKFSLLGKSLGEVIVRGGGEGLSGATFSIYNRGDDEQINQTKYNDIFSEWSAALSKKLDVRAQDRSKSGAVELQGQMWRKGDTAYLLEGSVEKKSKRVEFIRLRVASAKSTHGKKRIKSRSSLSGNVVEKNGDVLIENVPMVDQGQKGYCVVASVERVVRYFGLDADQHELAQVANTTRGGTSGEAMEEAFSKLTGKLHIRTLKFVDYDYKQVERDYKAYNREAKKQGKKSFDIDLDRYIINAQVFWMKLDKEVYKEVKGKESRYKVFTNKMESFIDQGIPICWTLNLGMFPEKGLPQSFGGHMRLIIGYNEEKEEIIYTDSWGKGHEQKRMSTVEAWCMTMGAYAMMPNR